VKDIKEFSIYLRESREKAGLTQSEVAKELGYSTAQFISNWERGLSYPPLKTLSHLANMYKVNMDQLFQAIMTITMQATEESLRKQYKTLVRKRG
jgi:transcriptional regulator with XRE-family HTH domain